MITTVLAVLLPMAQINVFRFHQAYSDGMILQRAPSAASISGWANPGESYFFFQEILQVYALAIILCKETVRTHMHCSLVVGAETHVMVCLCMCVCAYMGGAYDSFNKCIFCMSVTVVCTSLVSFL